jgi:hypothetical protein
MKNLLFSASLRQRYSSLLWGSIAALYGLLIVVAKLPVRSSGSISDFFGVTIPAVIRQFQGDKVGIFGLAVCGLWWLRDRTRMGRRNREEPPVNS